MLLYVRTSRRSCVDPRSENKSAHTKTVRERERGDLMFNMRLLETVRGRERGDLMFNMRLPETVRHRAKEPKNKLKQKTKNNTKTKKKQNNDLF